MKQKITLLNKNTKAVIIPNTILKKLGEPESFEMFIENGRIVLEPIDKKDAKSEKLLGDNSLDLYKVD